MTKKTKTIAGRRPDLVECLEAWWRVADSPAGRILPDTPHGEPGDTVRLCDAFDLYCWRLVGEALSACKVRNVPPTRLERLVAHVQCGGTFGDFHVYDVVQRDPADAGGWRSQARPITEVDRLGIDEASLARAAYSRFRKVLQRMIDEAEPYVRPARAEVV
ncbi:MAG TPA: hypothetical protein VHE55_11330 [Fimbriimonadaceae bacterium]|nr:hypothetical protein [Fimbriimonadaceae bacterium]